MAGMILRDKNIIFDDKRTIILSFVLYTLLFICLFDADMLHEKDVTLDVNMYNVNIGILYERCIRVLMGVSGAVFTIALITKLCHSYYGSIMTAFSYIGQESMGVYIIQSFLVERIAARMVNMSTLSIPTYNIITFCAAILAILTCYYITKMIKRNKVTSLFLMGTFRK